jgi:6-pyruvoyl-tetrahydropterin synthase related domain
VATVTLPRLGELSAARMRAVWVQRALTLATFATIYVVLIRVLHLNLILSRTTAAGGDMGSHHYIDAFLRQQLLPHGRITGWAPGWYAGIPMLTFYFPLPYVLIAALTPLLGNQVAFKLVTTLGLFGLPLTCWGAFKVLRLPDPAPLLAAVAGTAFLFLTSFQIYGGNIMSTMAGEFPFALSFSLLPLALALLFRVAEEGRAWRAAAVTVAALVLCHILTTIVLVLGASILVVRLPAADAARALGRLARAFAVAFCLTAFWSLPFIARQPYTAHFGWTQLNDAKLLFPLELRPYLVFTAIGMILAVVRGERRVLLYAWPAAISVCLFGVLARYAKQASLWNARLLPFIYLCFLLVAAYGAAVACGRLVALLREQARVPVRLGYVVLLVVLAATPIVGSWRHRGLSPAWAQYNYEGFEVKSGWPEAAALFNTIAGLPRGRVMWEFNRDYERFGTTRTLENMPVRGFAAGQDTMEGLLIESSISAPFHFINQKETSETATEAVPGIQYPAGFDFTSGLRHLRLFGVRWYVAYTDQAKKAAAGAGLPVRATSGRFTIYEVGDGHLVEVPPNRPVLMDDPDWRKDALTWYRTPEWLDTPLVFASHRDAAARAAFPDAGPLPTRTLPRQPLANPGPVPSREVSPSEIDFTTDRIGEPHIVKVSYFPNWHAEGAKGPWMLSPSLMVVVPTQAQVRLVYRDTPVDVAGKLLTLAGLLALGLARLRRVPAALAGRARRPSRPEPPAGRRAPADRRADAPAGGQPRGGLPDGDGPGDGPVSGGGGSGPRAG